MRRKVNQMIILQEGHDTKMANIKFLISYMYTIFLNFTHLTSHRFCVDLAHISTGIILLNIRYVQFPRVMSIMRNRESWIMCY